MISAALQALYAGDRERGEELLAPGQESVFEAAAFGRVARLVREGEDVTIVAYGAMVPVAEVAADALDASVEVLDVRTLKPLDEESLLASAAKTGRVVIVQEAPRTCGYAAELAAVLAEKAILDLRGPVVRVTGYDVPYPYWQLEEYYVPSVARVVDAARRLLAEF